jgi:5-(carboxyamino)imidazole ribonucleotide synthase
VDARTGLPVVGMVGAGQLARMTHQAAIALGQSVRLLAESADDGAALVAADVVVGDYRQLADLRQFARGCDVITFDHEQVPQEQLRALAADGVTLAPGPDALRFAQDKIAMRTRLGELGIAVPAWTALTGPDAGDLAEDLQQFGEVHGWPIVLKAATGGYDGRGVWIASTLAEATTIATELIERGIEVLVEQRVELKRELAAVVARSPFGQGGAWPVVETVQRDGICVEVVAPAPGLTGEQADHAQQLALRLAQELDVVGVLAVELFETADGQLLVNELAMRPHNSGHWTMDGSRTSQFEQHLRAVLDYPLGDTEAIAPVTVMANVLGAAKTPAMPLDERLHHLLARMPDARVHLYGKEERPGRKIGHINFLGWDPLDVAVLRERGERAAHWLSHGQWTDGWDPHD